MKESGTYIMMQDLSILQGKNISEIAREMGMSRTTVRQLLKNGHHPHASIGKPRASKLDLYKPYIQELIKQGIYNASVIEERIQAIGYEGSITILKEFIAPLRPPAIHLVPAAQRYETKPGKQAQMDWGYMDYRDLTGKIRKVACFVMILGYSRTRYIEFSRRCDEASLLRCMINAFEYFGGIPDVVLTDRMKTVIVSVDNGKPVWQETFKQFATDMNFIPKVCRVKRPETKGKVERLVEYVRENFIPGRSFVDFGDLQVQARAWCDHVNAKAHGTTGEPPLELLKVEPLRSMPHESICRRYRWESRKVSRDGFVSYNGALYGVNWRHSCKQVRVYQNGVDIMIVDNDGEILQTHSVCHKSRKHVYAKDQYVGLQANNGIPHTRSCATQLAADDVEVRSLEVYEQFAEVG